MLAVLGDRQQGIHTGNDLVFCGIIGGREREHAQLKRWISLHDFRNCPYPLQIHRRFTLGECRIAVIVALAENVLLGKFCQLQLLLGDFPEAVLEGHAAFGALLEVISAENAWFQGVEGGE
ncbi:hypothetical protein D3C75_984020 [compost metagenome]